MVYGIYVSVHLSIHWSFHRLF